MTIDASFWADRRVVVTGHTGFKGAWLSSLLASLGSRVTGVGLAAPRGGVFELAGVDSRVDSREVDIRNATELSEVFERAQPQSVFHLAAQALVPASYRDPIGTFDVNVIGTAHVLDAAGACSSVREVLVVTSDKVYANSGDGRAFREGDRLGGGDPYSASKAACEVVVDCWRELLAPRDVHVVSARAGNVIGGGDVAEGRLVPDVFRALAGDGCVRLRNPDAIRPWQLVHEPVFGYLEFLQEVASGTPTPPTLNFGPNPGEERSVKEVVERLLTLIGRGSWQQTDDRDGPEATTLALDPSLAFETIGWQPRLSLDDALAWTAEWFTVASSGGDCRALCDDQIARYRALASP